MENIQVLRYMAVIEQRVKVLENNFNSLNIASNSSSIPPLTTSLNVHSLEDDIKNRLTNIENKELSDFNDLTNRLTNIENLQFPNFTDLLERLKNLENKQLPDLNDIYNRLSALESKPELSQRLSALELTVATLNTN